MSQVPGALKAEETPPAGKKGVRGQEEKRGHKDTVHFLKDNSYLNKLLRFHECPAFDQFTSARINNSNEG